jgi:hypothetical protein
MTAVHSTRAEKSTEPGSKRALKPGFSGESTDPGKPTIQIFGRKSISADKEYLSMV